MPRRRRFAVAVVLLGALVACSSDHPPAQRPSRAPDAAAETPVQGDDRASGGGTLRVAVETPSTLLPGDATTASELALVDTLFDSLTAWTVSGEVVPRAAVRWDATPDATQWTFRLRPNAAFHDGTPVTAHDVQFAWERAVAAGASGYHLSDVEGYEALASGDADELAGVTARSERILEVRLSRPQADFPAIVAHPSLAPIPAQSWSADPEAFHGMPIGNGPFAMAEPWEDDDLRGDFVRVVRFEGWRNAPTSAPATSGAGPGELAEVVFRFMDPATAYLAFQQQRVDVAPVPDEALGSAVERYGRATDGYAGPGVLLGATPVLYALGFNVGVEPFDDPAVRRAVNLAVDREALLDAQPAGNLFPARAAVPAGVPGARRAPCRDCSHQPAVAAAILAERGVSELRLWTSRGEGHERVARRLRTDLGAVGVRLDVRVVDFSDYLAAVRDGDAGLFRLGWAVDYPTMDNALYPLFHSSAVADEGLDAGYNVTRYASADVDALLEDARATLDPGDRQALYQQAEDLVLDRDHAIVPLLMFGHQLVVADRVDGFTVSPMGTLSLDEVELSALE